MNRFHKQLRAIFVVGILGLLLMGSALQAQLLGGADDPVQFLQSYIDTLNRRDYVAAYNAWVTPPGGATFDAFASGYATTASVSAFVRLPVFYGSAAGTTYVDIAALVVGVQNDGSQRVFTGCYTVRRQNVEGGDPNWRLFNAQLTPQTSADLSTLRSACQNHLSFGDGTLALTSQNTPSDMLGSYFDTVVRMDYARAYGYWETPPQNQSLAQYINGFSGLGNMELYLRLTTATDAGAGNIYTTLPAILHIWQRGGTQQYFAGCYTAHRTNVPVGSATEPNPNWYLARARVLAATSLAAAATRSATICPVG